MLVARVVNRLGAFALPFLTLLLTRDLGATPQRAGVVGTAFGVATIPSRLLGGRLADRVGRRCTITLGLAACAVADAGLVCARSLEQASAAAIALGLAFELYEAPSQSLVADAVDPEDRPAAFGALGAGLAIAGLAAGALAAALMPYGIRWLFAVDGASCLVAAGVVAILVPADRRRPTTGASPVTAPWRHPALLALFAVNAVFAACVLQTLVALPLTIEQRGVDARAYGALLALSAGVTVAAQWLLRRARGPRSSPRAAAVGLLLTGVGLAGYAPAGTLAAFAAATVVVAVGEVLLAGHLLTLVAGLAPAAWRGRYLAAYGLSWGIALAVGPAAGTTLMSHAGVTAVWWVTGGCCATLGLAGCFGTRYARCPCEIGASP